MRYRSLCQILGMVTVLSALGGCSGQPQNMERPLPVVVSPVIQRDTPIYLEVIGNVYASSTVQIRPQISGKLLEVHFTEGDFAEQGELLYSIDPVTYQAALDKAKATLSKDEASLTFAKKKVERYAELVKKDYVSPLNFDQYQTDVKSYEAQVEIDKADIETAQINLDYSYIRAPLAGRLGENNVDPGNLVAPTDPQPLTSLLQISPIDVTFSLAQQDLMKVKNALALNKTQFDVLLSEQKDNVVSGGSVYFIDNHIDLATGTVLLKGELPNTDRRLWPGEFVRVRILLKIEPNALLVPSAAVQYGQQGSFVYVLKPDQTVDLHVVKLGAERDGLILIEEGLTATDSVVIDGQINLRPGAKVIVLPPKEQGKAQS